MDRFESTYSGWFQKSVLDRESTREAVLKLRIPELSDPVVICDRHILQTEVHILVKNILFCLHRNLNEIYTKILILFRKQGHLSPHCLCGVRQFTPQEQEMLGVIESFSLEKTSRTESKH